jgi:MFS family permease
MTSFIIARAVCGLGAGGMMAMGSIITSDLVPIEIRGIYQSYINIIFGIGSAMGAALGGAIADSLGWRWEFGVQVPLIAVCVIGCTFTVPRKLGLAAGVEKKSLWEAMKVFDYKGSLLLTSSITFLILGIVSPLRSTSYYFSNRNRTSEAISSPGPTRLSLPPS